MERLGKCVLIRASIVGMVLYLVSCRSLYFEPMLDMLLNNGTGTDKEIASIKQWPPGAPCEDDMGGIRQDGEVWRNEGQCDLTRCHHGYYANYSIEYRCREFGVNENPDEKNCRFEQNMNLTYPSCCPELTCSESIPPTGIPPGCYDRQNNASCSIWKDYFDGCSNTSDVYNFTSVYCQLTCRFC